MLNQQNYLRVQKYRMTIYKKKKRNVPTVIYVGLTISFCNFDKIFVELAFVKLSKFNTSIS